MTTQIAKGPTQPFLVTQAIELAPVGRGKPVVLPGQGPTVALADVRTFDSALADALTSRLDHSKTVEGGLRVAKHDALEVLSSDELARFDVVCNGLTKVAQAGLDQKRALWGIGAATTIVAAAAALSGNWIVGAFLGTTALGAGMQLADMVRTAYDRKILFARASTGLPESIKAIFDPPAALPQAPRQPAVARD